MRPSGQQPRERDNLQTVWQVQVNTFSISAGDQDTRQPRTQRGSAQDRSEIAPWLWSSSERDWGHEMVQTVLSTRSSRVSLQPGCGSSEWGPNWLGGRPQYSEDEIWFPFKSNQKFSELTILRFWLRLGRRRSYSAMPWDTELVGRTWCLRDSVPGVSVSGMRSTGTTETDSHHCIVSGSYNSISPLNFPWQRGRIEELAKPCVIFSVVKIPACILVDRTLSKLIIIQSWCCYKHRTSTFKSHRI